METLAKFAAVAGGGAIGAIARYSLNQLFAKIFAPFPFATFFINITGSFLIGFLAVVFTEKLTDSENWRLFLMVGLLGAYTTFSTFELETFELMREKQLLVAFFYVAVSFAVGLIGVFSGVWLGKKM